MFRIIMLVVRGLFSIPGWYLEMKKIEHDENVTREKRYALAQKIVHWIMKHGSIYPTITGTENLPKENGYLIAPNHQGLFDPVIICDSHPRYTTAVVKIELTKTFFVKDLIHLLKALPMDRQDLRQSMKVIREVTGLLHDGYNCIIFPEGTRSKNGNQMGEFKAGSFKGAYNAKAPIVPVALIDCFKVFDENGIGKAYPQCHYLEPIYYEEYQDMTTEEIASVVKNRIQAKIDDVLSNH